jgi:hypothetical protein
LLGGCTVTLSGGAVSAQPASQMGKPRQASNFVFFMIFSY